LKAIVQDDLFLFHKGGLISIASLLEVGVAGNLENEIKIIFIYGETDIKA